jgi:2-dehydro-3-deoxygluconokinase
MAEVVTLGETMVLLVPSTDGTLDTVTHFTMTHGGAETNLGIGLVRLGHSVAWISRLGSDPFGTYLLRTLSAEGLDVSQVTIDSQAPTGVFFRERVPGHPPVGYYYRRGSAASRLCPSDLSSEMFEGAKILHCTGITPILSADCRDAVYQAIAYARGRKVRVCFDPNLRLRLVSIEQARQILLPLMREADIVLSGLGEMRLLLDEEEPTTMAARLREDYGVDEIVFKDGARGAHVVSPLGRLVGIHPVTIGLEIDPTGAGDAFDSGYLAGRLRGMPPLAAAQLGAVMGGFAVAHQGDYENLPTWQSVQPYLRQVTDEPGDEGGGRR